MSSLSEDTAERARRYISTFEKSVQKLIQAQKDSTVKAADIKRVSDTMLRYLQDAKYYLQNDKPVTSLASIAYAEGLLDALTFLKLAETNLPEKSI